MTSLYLLKKLIKPESETVSIWTYSMTQSNMETGRQLPIEFFLTNYPTGFMYLLFFFFLWIIESLRGTWCSLSRTCCLTGKPQTSSCLHLPRTRIKSTLYPIQVISGSQVLGITLRMQESTLLTEPSIFSVLLLIHLNDINKTNK